jgi:hypothetical protein
MLSIFGAGASFVGIALATLVHAPEIRFETMRPIYMMQVARASAPNGKPKKLSWWWSGGLGWDASLSYDETDADAPAPGQVIAVRDAGGCSLRIRPMGGHFYFHDLRCGGDPWAAIEAGYQLGRKIDQQQSR